LTRPRFPDDGGERTNEPSILWWHQTAPIEVRDALALGAITAAVALVIAPGVEAKANDAALLERYRPTLRYDAAEEYFAQPVSLPPGSPEVRSGDRVYGHVAVEDGETWLQYWLFYAYNPQDRSPLATGRHEGDWELMQVRLGTNRRPTLATLSQHSWAEACGWADLEHGRSGAPVLYVANGSHALYSRAGRYDRPFPDPTDEADGDGRSVRPALTEITDRAPVWIRYPGPWGQTEAGVIPGEMSSPPGPRFQASGAWDRPASYAADLARPCGSGAPRRPWQTVAMLAAGAILALVGTALLRRRSLR
jgi:hypothetical protein